MNSIEGSPDNRKDERPNPIVRQRDLDVVVANNRTEHWRTRALLVGAVIATNSPLLPKTLGELGIPFSWGMLWPF